MAHHTISLPCSPAQMLFRLTARYPLFRLCSSECASRNKAQRRPRPGEPMGLLGPQPLNRDSLELLLDPYPIAHARRAAPRHAISEE